MTEHHLTDQLVLNAFVYPEGHHEAAWRHPSTTPERLFDPEYFIDIAETAERGLLDAIFFADSPAVTGDVELRPGAGFEPLTLLSAIAARTEHIGLVATASTTYNEPYNLARAFASLDLISGGRAGWNIVTTAAEVSSANFGLTGHPSAEERYARATEFVEAVLALWDSWEEDALVIDRDAGRFADPARVHPADYRGRSLATRGPLNVPRSPQGHPVLVQAGSSNAGRALGGRFAEAIFTAHQRLEDAVDFAGDIRARAAASGRSGADVRILPGLSPFIGATEKEARELEAEFTELINPAFTLPTLNGLFDLDFTEDDLDTVIPLSAVRATGRTLDNNHSRSQVVAGIIERERPTVRQLLGRLAGARGHRVFTGTPVQVADTIEEWFRAGAADGFNIMPPAYPTGLEVFVDEVVPILQERGLFRTEYPGTTLRGSYGLEVPENRWTARRDGTVEGSARVSA
ncbi:LLM class flavin-dependent oxidoreductase [uncultured Corynebacterium sp.]|uniref:LLM class flavin-dependent oxidoreductase n=1 Tax=uncultured Corynebacterium sp. TaxID=159447 RepID=UPI0025E93819|nr:LLM class flavin-dependent oxidoreductase [uncultured Corynebacterium sp.]